MLKKCHEIYRYYLKKYNDLVSYVLLSQFFILAKAQNLLISKLPQMQTKAILLIKHSIFRIFGDTLHSSSQGRIVRMVGSMNELICDMYAFL